MKYKTDCENCLFNETYEILPGIKAERCTMGGPRVYKGIGATRCPLNRLLAEIEKAIKEVLDHGKTT